MTEKQAESPLDIISHHLIGGNPDDLETGSWPTKEEALTAFAVQFAELSQQAIHKYVFVRRPPELVEVRDFASDKVGYRMIGRFSIAKRKESYGD